jgi:hypothetical protein
LEHPGPKQYENEPFNRLKQVNPALGFCDTERERGNDERTEVTDTYAVEPNNVCAVCRLTAKI